jgi:hypothetical protein
MTRNSIDLLWVDERAGRQQSGRALRREHGPQREVALPLFLDEIQ